LENFILSAERITWLKAKRYKLKIENNNLFEITSQIIFGLKNKTIEKQISINNLIDKSINISFDKELLIISLNVLLGNAVKYSNENELVIIKTEINNDTVAIEVVDEGRGFSEFALKNIFKLFTKGNEFVDQNLGIDLALVKLIVDVHNGKIEVWNNEKGASVKITIPF
jgi:two-component system sensor histidine kinase/response regulator